jgi:hypothetical protein
MWSPFVPHIMTRVSKRQLPLLKARRRVVRLLLRDGNRQHLHFPLLPEGVTGLSYPILSTLWHPLTNMQSEGWGSTERFSLFCIVRICLGSGNYAYSTSFHTYTYVLTPAYTHNRSWLPFTPVWQSMYKHKYIAYDKKNMHIHTATSKQTPTMHHQPRDGQPHVR